MSGKWINATTEDWYKNPRKYGDSVGDSAVDINGKSTAYLVSRGGISKNALSYTIVYKNW